MKVSIMLRDERIETLVENARTAEAAGFDHVGFIDSQCLRPELHTSLGLLAAETESAEIGPLVTNPVTRHPTVTASALCTLDEIGDGRAVLGLASGDSAVRTIGDRPARLDELEEFVELHDDLVSGVTTEYRGETIELSWIDHHEIPVVLAADGPKTRRVAGTVADRVIIGNGKTPDIVENAIDEINSAAREADRNPHDVGKVVAVSVLLDDNPAEMRGPIAGSVATSAHNAFHYRIDEFVPEPYVEPSRELVREYQPYQHAGAGESNANRELVERLDAEHDGFLDFLVDRFCAVGAPQDCIDELDRIASIDGVDTIHVFMINSDSNEFLTRMGEEVLPSVQ